MPDEQPIQTLDVTTRGYELDVTRTVPLPVYLSYLEQLRWVTMQYPPLGLMPGLSEGHFFIVRAQTLELVRSIGLGHRVRLRCAVERVGRASAWVRHDVVRVDDGALVARARVQGVWMAPDRRMARLPAELKAFAARHPGASDEVGALDVAAHERARAEAPTTEAPSFVAQPDVLHAVRGLDLEPPRADDDRAAPPDLRDEVRVRPSDIDVFGHVNAATWVRLLDDARRSAGLDGRLLRVAIIYLREGLVGDTLDIEGRSTATGPVELVASRRGDDDGPLVLATLEFT